MPACILPSLALLQTQSGTTTNVVFPHTSYLTSPDCSSTAARSSIPSRRIFFEESPVSESSSAISSVGVFCQFSMTMTKERQDMNYLLKTVRRFSLRRKMMTVTIRKLALIIPRQCLHRKERERKNRVLEGSWHLRVTFGSKKFHDFFFALFCCFFRFLVLMRRGSVEKLKACAHPIVLVLRRDRDPCRFG